METVYFKSASHKSFICVLLCYIYYNIFRIFVPINEMQFKIIEKFFFSTIGINYKFKVVKTANILSYYKIHIIMKNNEIIDNTYVV